MALTSTLFFSFLIISLIAYYCVKCKNRWIVLLVASIIFYCSYSVSALLFVLVSSISVYFAAIEMERYEDKTIRRRIVILTLLLNFGILAVLKYAEAFRGIFANNRAGASFSLIVPIGISFYTFQLAGYVLDVYWKRDTAEKNYFKLLLFTVYFPQMIQGPISRHGALAAQFNRDEKFDFLNIKYGTQLIIWGLFKKLVIADTIKTAADEVLHNPGDYAGMTVVFGLLAYSAELYMDFSGGIDVIRGCSECFGIELADNFKRPFFSQSIQEFWRRWHITLGTWMKDYLFYPMALSKTMNELGKKCQKVFGRKTGRKIPICIENIVVFLVVGIWHGPSMHFVVYGLYNGLIIAISTLLEPVFEKMYSATHLSKDAWYMRMFRILRTFILINIGWLFDDVDSLRSSAVLARSIFLSGNTVYNVTYLGLLKYQYIYVAIGLLIVFAVSLMQERGVQVRKRIDSLPLVIKATLWIALIFMIPIMGWDPSVAGGFMYANF